MIYGVYPFKRNGRKMKELFEDIILSEVSFDNSAIPTSECCKSLIRSLLQKNHLERNSIVTNTDFQTWDDNKYTTYLYKY